MKYKPFNDIIKQIRYAKAVSEGAEITEDNKENQEETFQAIREPGIRKGPLKGKKRFFATSSTFLCSINYFLSELLLRVIKTKLRHAHYYILFYLALITI